MKKSLIAFGIISLLALFYIFPFSSKELSRTSTNTLPCEAGCPAKYGQNAVWDFYKKECWSCPPGYVRSLEPFTSRRACVFYKYGLYADAKRKGKLDCGETLIADSGLQSIR